MQSKKLKIASLMEIGLRLRNSRRELNMTQADAAKKAHELGCEIDASTVTRWENMGDPEKEGREGGCRQVAILATVLNLTPNDLLLSDPVVSESGISDEGLKQLSELLKQIERLQNHMSRTAAVKDLTNFLRKVNDEFDAEEGAKSYDPTSGVHGGASRVSEAAEPRPDKKKRHK